LDFSDATLGSANDCEYFAEHTFEQQFGELTFPRERNDFLQHKHVFSIGGNF
jgi:hypothetical protein